MDQLRIDKKSLARVNIKINNYTLLDEKVSNKDKFAKAKKIVDFVRANRIKCISRKKNE